jgi:hypothetical protein
MYTQSIRHVPRKYSRSSLWTKDVMSLFRLRSLGKDRFIHVLLTTSTRRPEKNHKLQLQIIKQFVDTVDTHIQLCLIGGCRNDGDAKRVQELKDMARELKIEVKYALT